MHAIWALLALGMQGSLYIGDDPRLAMPCSMTVDKIDLRALARDTGKIAGIPLAANPAVACERVTLNVHERPLGEILAKVADCLDLDWRQNGRGYVLLRRPEVERMRHDYLRQYEAISDEALSAQIALWRRETPADDAKARLDTRAQLDAEWTQIFRAAHWSASQEQIRELQEERNKLRQERPEDRAAAIRLAKAMSPADIETLRKGVWVFGWTKQVPGAVTLPPEIGDASGKLGSRAGAIYIGLQFDRLARKLRGRTGHMGDRAATREFEISLGRECRMATVGSAVGLANRLIAWANFYDEPRQDFSPETYQQEREREDAIRTTLPTLPLVETGDGWSGVPVDELERTVGHTRSQDPGYWRIADGWLMHRSPGYWRHPDQSVWQPIKWPTASDQCTSAQKVLDALSRLAAEMPEDASLQSVADEVEAGGLTLGQLPDRGADACLRLWSTLSESQKKRLLSTGLLRKDLTEAQRVEEDGLARLNYPEGMYGNPAAGADHPLPLLWAEDERIPLRLSVQISLTISCIDENGSRGYQTAKRDDLKWCLQQNQSAPDALSTACVQWYFAWYFPCGNDRHDAGALWISRDLWRGTWKDWVAPAPSLLAIVQPIWDTAAKWEAVRNRLWQEEQKTTKPIMPAAPTVKSR
jgi:hypothetical protein